MLGIQAIIRARGGEQQRLYGRHINPRLARLLRIIGFDRTYARAKGCTLTDAEGRVYLDFMAGWGGFQYRAQSSRGDPGAARRAGPRPGQPGATGYAAPERPAGRGPRAAGAAGHRDVQPDVITVAKGLSAGLVPVGAALMRRDIFRETSSRLERCPACPSTFSENPLGMVAGLAALRSLDEEDLVGNAARRGARLVGELERIQQTSGLMRQVRGRGLLVGVEFGEPDALALRIPWKRLKNARPDVFAQVIATALFTDYRSLTEVAGPGLSTIKLRPPLPISEAEVATFVRAFEATLTRARTFPGPLWKFGMRLAQPAVAS